MGRSKGEGSEPKQRKDGRWACHVTVLGKRKDLYGDSRKKASEAMKAWLASPEALNPHRAGSPTVEHLLDAWLFNKKRTVKDKTYRSYETVVRIHIKPRIGMLDPAKVTSRHASALLADMETAVKVGRKEGSTDLVGPRTREIAYIVLGSAFKLIAPGLLDNVQKPKGEREEMHPWDADEAKRFLAHVDTVGDQHAALYRLALTTGLRKGEMLALTVADVDLKTGRTSITKTWNEKILQSGSPKSKSSKRTVILSERTRLALRSYIMATGRRGDDRIFPFEVRNLAKSMTKAMRSAKLPVIRFHDLRHTYATVALNQGQPLRAVSEALGHANPAITLNVYTHVMPGQAEAVANAVDAAIG